jgi:uncharacterized protein with FMN-binding domain
MSTQVDFFSGCTISSQLITMLSCLNNCLQKPAG